jgi:hypothetical protein
MKLGAIVMVVILLLLMGAGTVQHATQHTKTNTPEAALQSFLDQVRAKHWDEAYSMIQPGAGVDKDAFIKDLGGNNGSLKTISSLQSANTKILQQSSNNADIRADLQWSTAVGALHETRDFKLVSDDGQWLVDWPAAPKSQDVAKALPTTYLRWDVVQRGSVKDEWGVQNVEAPRMRIISMNAIENQGDVVILGEVVNEDTVPGFVTINAILLDKDGNSIAEESSFDKISHTLLPKEISPFRIDFPNRKLAEIKSVRISPTNILVPAAADPVVGVMNQRIEKDQSGKSILRGDLVVQGGQTVNIPHVLATFYDRTGKVIWVSDGYVDRALLPQQAVPFAVNLRDDLAAQVQNYRITVNYYNSNRS